MTRRLNKVTLEKIRVLDAIERLGSFAAAAQELHLVTSSITHVVRNLEDTLGVTLFDRSGRRARFTREGSALLERGRLLLARAAEFEQEVQLITTGWEASLTLSVDQVIRLKPLMPLIDAFFKAAPQTSLHVTREAAAGSWDALLSGRADLIVGAPANGPAGGGYESAPLYETKYVLAVAASHPLAGRKDVIPNEEIAQHRSVVIGDTARALPHLPYGLLDNRLCLSVPDADAKIEAILLGTGCGFLPTRIADPLVRAGKLALLRVETPHPPAQRTLAWRAGENGRAMQWWRKKLLQASLARSLFY